MLKGRSLETKLAPGAVSGSCFSQQLGPGLRDTGNIVPRPLAAAPRITGPGQREK